MNRTFALAAMAAMTCATAAVAQNSNPLVHTELVAFADLDLDTAAGIRILDRRILRAVQAACGTDSATDVTGSNAVRRCRRQLLADLTVQRNRAISADRPHIAAR